MRLLLSARRRCAQRDLRGVLNLAGVVCERLRWHRGRRFAFVIRQAEATPSPLNPLHMAKRSYTFVAENEQDANEWVAAINEALSCIPSSPSRQPSSSDLELAADEDEADDTVDLASEHRCVEWGEALGSCADSLSYRKCLRALCRSVAASSGASFITRSAERIAPWEFPTRPVAELDSSWARVQLRAVWERELGEAGVNVMTRSLRSPWARHAHPFDLEASDTVSSKLPVIPTLRMQPGASGETLKAVREAERAVAEAAAGAAKRMWGYSPGDRVPLRQLQRDTERDTVVVMGETLEAPAVELVFDCLCQAVASELRRSDGSWQDDDNAGIAQFAAEVLHGSSRTVAGGDAYEALELLLRSPSSCVIVPESSLASPISLTVGSSLSPYTPVPIHIPARTPPASESGEEDSSPAADAECCAPSRTAGCVPAPPLTRAELAIASEGPLFAVAESVLFYRIKSLDLRDVHEPVDTDELPPRAETSSPAFSDASSDGDAPSARHSRSIISCHDEGLPWQQGDISFVMAHFRKVFSFPESTGHATVRLFVLVRRALLHD
jgi:hypothetical protein